MQLLQILHNLDDLREIHAYPFKVVYGRDAVVVPSAALIYGVTQKVILFLAVGAQHLHFFSGTLSFRVEADLFPELFVIPLRP